MEIMIDGIAEERRAEVEFRKEVWQTAEAYVDRLRSDVTFEPYKLGGGFTQGTTVTVLDQHVDAIMRVAEWLMESPEEEAPKIEIRPINFLQTIQNLPRTEDAGYVLKTRKEADEVIKTLSSIIDRFSVVTRSELHELLGIPWSHEDALVGWIEISAFELKQTRDGWALTPDEPINLPQGE